jgi:hypothetical protein
MHLYVLTVGSHAVYIDHDLGGRLSVPENIFGRVLKRPVGIERVAAKMSTKKKLG